MIGDSLEIYSFTYLLNQALADVPDTLDKREGSIIYDALAPACYRLAEFYTQLRNMYLDTFADTSTGEFLEHRVAEQGLTRYAASYAVKKAYFTNSSGTPMTIPLGSRFSTVSDVSPITYYVLEVYTSSGSPVPGYYKLKCETAGTVGNDYTGNLLSISNLPGISSATMSDLLTPARDVETDEQLRSRYFDAINQKAFGGNRSQYDEELKAISGIGEVQIYPVWDGGGTVKCSIIDPQYARCSTEFIATVQALIDPQNSVGDPGVGLGIAPIGHTVTIVTPDNLTVNISATVVLVAGYTIEQLQDTIESAIEEYFLSQRKLWGVSNMYGDYSLSIYISRITAAVLTVTGVANVTNVLLNGSASDITLTQTGTTQQLPILGTVTLSE